MNRVDELFAKNPKPADFARGYFKYLSEIFEKMDHQAIETFVNKCIEAVKKDRRSSSWQWRKRRYGQPLRERHRNRHAHF